MQLVAYSLYKMTSCFYFAGLDNLNYVELYSIQQTLIIKCQLFFMYSLEYIINVYIFIAVNGLIPN